MGPLFQLNQQLVFTWGLRFAVLLLCLPVHEFAHAWAANKLGDDTAARQGRLTLNPFVHLDILGGILLLFAGFGWAKPVPVDTRVFKRPRRDMALVAAAGPLANIAMASVMIIAVMIVERTVTAPSAFPAAGVVMVLDTMLFINLILAVFNLLPVPPLDGSKFFGAFLPERYYFGMMRYERFVIPVLFVLMFTGFIGPVIWGLAFRLEGALYNIISWPVSLVFGG